MSDYNQDPIFLGLVRVTEAVGYLREQLKAVRTDIVPPNINRMSMTRESLLEIAYECAFLERAERSIKALILKELSRGSGPGTYDPNFAVGQDHEQRNKGLSMLITEMGERVNDPHLGDPRPSDPTDPTDPNDPGPNDPGDPGPDDNFEKSISYTLIPATPATGHVYLCTYPGCKPNTTFKFMSKLRYASYSLIFPLKINLIRANSLVGRDHHSVHSQRRFKCYICSNGFGRKRSLEKHQRNKHGESTLSGSVGSSQPPLDHSNMAIQPGPRSHPQVEPEQRPFVYLDKPNFLPHTYGPTNHPGNYPLGTRFPSGHLAQPQQDQIQPQGQEPTPEVSSHPTRPSQPQQIAGPKISIDDRCIDPTLENYTCSLSDIEIQRIGDAGSQSSKFTFGDYDMGNQ